MKPLQNGNWKFESEKIMSLPKEYDSKICTKIDWLSVIFNDMSIFDVLEFLKLQNAADEFYREYYTISQGFDDFMIFKYEGVTIQADDTYFYGVDNCDDAFELTVPKIKLDLSGRGLDYLRSIGIDVEKYFRNGNNYPQPFHLTRVDFAFDFINYAPQLVDQVIEYCETQHTDADRLCFYKNNSGCKYRIVKGGQKTVYIGSTTSEQMLRIYDKRLQYIDPRTGYYIKENEYNNPVSWIRIELQLRRMKAENMCFSPSDTYSILKFIYDKYCFADTLNTTHHNRKPAKFWQDLFNWEEIPGIIQKQNVVQYVPADERVVGSFLRTINNFIAVYSMLGPDEFKKMVDEYMIYLSDTSNPLARKKLMRLLGKINELNIKIDQYSYGLYNANPFGSEMFIGFRMKGANS